MERWQLFRLKQHFDDLVIEKITDDDFILNDYKNTTALSANKYQLFMIFYYIKNLIEFMKKLNKEETILENIEKYNVFDLLFQLIHKI